ncbi:GNAT family N-acetyltransferase [Streptomyces altiplanensis]
MPPTVRLEPWSEGDLGLLRRANAPEMTEHVGGPETEEQVLARHRRYVNRDGTHNGRMFRVVLLPDGGAVGTIGFWSQTWHGGAVYETGWSVLPEFQGRGVATAAAAATIASARAEGGHRFLHAFPSVGNPASNALCRKAGFELAGPCDFEFPPGSIMRCNDWRLDLTA